MNHAAVMPYVHAIGWALVHFLWQGALLGLAAWFALRLFRRRSPLLKYRVACAFFGTMVLAFLITARMNFQPVGEEPVLSGLAAIVRPDGAAPMTAWSGMKLKLFLDGHIHWLMLGWAFGCFAMLVRFGAGLGWLYGPCLHQARPVDGEWTQRFVRLCSAAQLIRPVRLMVSDLVDSPMVMGWWRPVVLVPAAAFLALDPLSLEAVLAHELSHVRRHDFIVNLLQGMAEVVLFYHPAVWWVSRQIRREREHCCDDAAVRLCGDSLLYASALARLEETRSTRILIPVLAPAARGGSLMSRIQRMLAPHFIPGLPLPGSLAVLLVCSAIGSASLLASGQEATKKATTKKPAAQKTAPASEVGTLVQVERVDVSSLKVVKRPPMPNYPEEAKKNRVQGDVELELTINAQGKVTEVKAVAGPEELRSAAEQYAKQWEFKPYKAKGETKPAKFKLTMKYALKK